MQKRLKKFVKRVAHQKNLRDQAIVVAGLGRCGTTLLYDALVKYGFQPGDMIERLEGYDNYQKGAVYKTHDFPPSALPSFVKMVFMFGNPMNTVLSAHRKINEWGREHFYHLHSAEFSDNEILLKSDALGLERQFACWYQQQKFPFLSVRYESLWTDEARDALSSFIGFCPRLPPFQVREAKWEQSPHKADLERIYGALFEVTQKVESIRLWR